jgi:hypothetical protein
VQSFSSNQIRFRNWREKQSQSALYSKFQIFTPKVVLRGHGHACGLVLQVTPICIFLLFSWASFLAKFYPESYKIWNLESNATLNCIAFAIADFPLQKVMFFRRHHHTESGTPVKTRTVLKKFQAVYHEKESKWCLGLTGSKRLEEVKKICTKEKEKGIKIG